MKRSVVLGNFDGVHIAHKKLIENACSKGIETVAFMFEQHPLEALGKKIKIITENDVKREIIESLGCRVHFEPVTKKLLSMEPESFVKEILCERFSASAVSVGYNYTFGKNGSGTARDLKAFGEKYGFSVDIMEEVKFSGRTVSSTLIREMLEAGDIENVNRLLSMPYKICAKVGEGKKLGRRLGFPTCNLEFSDNLIIPKNGVYVSYTKINGMQYKSVTNIGTNPTFENVKPRAESHILDFCEDVYGEKVEITLLKKIRDEIKFENSEELTEQVSEDICKTRKYFEKTFDNSGKLC